MSALLLNCYQRAFVFAWYVRGFGAVVLVPTSGTGSRSPAPRPWGLEGPGLSHHTHVLIHPPRRLPLTLLLHSYCLDPILLAGSMHRDGHPAEFRPFIAF